MQAPPPMADPVQRQIFEINTRAMINLTNMLGERCFESCVKDYLGEGLNQTEAACVQNCAIKYLSVFQRCSERAVDIQVRKQSQPKEKLPHIREVVPHRREILDHKPE